MYASTEYRHATQLALDCLQESGLNLTTTVEAPRQVGQFDPLLIARYNVNGPRYTSYPTANLFAGCLDENLMTGALESLVPSDSLSLYVHVPFCDTICYYCGCNKIVTNNRAHAAAYLERLLREIELVGARLQPGQRVEQLHFGGGTPTYFSNEQFRTIFAALHANTVFTEDPALRDFSIEIDPRAVDAERMRFLTGLGINRVSIGIQDFDPDVQRAVNRIQSLEQTAAVVAAARKGGVRSVSVDLIYGLPHQRLETFDETLSKVIALAPDRISLYNYAHLPHLFKTQKQIDATALPDAHEKLALMALAVERLGDAGYLYVGMDHFARPDDTLAKAREQGSLQRNFQGYTTHGNCQLIGLGVSAISSIHGTYSQNAKTLNEYYARIDAGSLASVKGFSMSSEDRLRRRVISDLMCQYEVDIDAIETEFGIDFQQHFASAVSQLETMQVDGLVRVEARSIRVLESGRFLLRNIAMAFDAYLPANRSGFSKAV